ncbi:MAG: TonB-dependent receptor [Candidatus Eisenbacteria bacterium]
MTRSFLLLVAAACLAIAASPWVAGAGTTGKLAGRAVDRAGQPLAGVNVALPAARLGALSDDAGYFTILNVPPGTYEVRASMIGRRTVTVTQLVVSSDRTTKVDLTLEDEALNLKGIEVVAKRPLVDSDLTSTRFVLRGEDIAKLPVQDLQEVVNLQAGVVDGHFRGGRSGEVQYQVSGVPVNNLYDNSAGIKLDRSILQEVQVISGTFDAEYGQALSGVVNAVLKSGGDRLAWNAELYTGDFVFGGNGARPVSDHFRPLTSYQLQGSLSGPLGIAGTSFLVSGRRYGFEDYLRGEQRFRPTDRGDFQNKVFEGSGLGRSEPLGYSREWSGVAKVTNRSWPSITTSYEALFNFINSRRASFAWRLNPDGLRTQRTWNLVHGFDWNQRLSAKSFYNVSLRKNIVRYRDRVFESLFDPRYDEAGAPKSDPSYELGAIVQGAELGRFVQTTNAFVGKASWSSQVHRYHLVKAGFELQLPEVRFGSPGTIVEGTVDGEQGMTRHTDQPPDFLNVQEYKPVLAGAFAQDQVEWRDLTVRGGLRMEYFDSRSRVPTDLANPANAIDGAPRSAYLRPHRKVSLAPRLGVSYPVGAKAAVFFAYGHFYQLPAIGTVFTNADYSVLANLQAGEQRFSVFGNPDISPEFTVQYEFGYKHAISEDLGLDFTVFYKDIRDLLGVEFISTYAAAEYARLTNVDFGNVRGLTLALDHRALGRLSASMDYTWQLADGNSSDPRETATRAENGEDPRPRLVPLNWDQRHTLNLTLTLSEPQRWTASSVVRAVSGQPYSPETLSGATGALEANSGRKANALLVDVRGERTLARTRDLKLFGRVFNLFDTRAFNGFVFNDTGSPDYTRQPATRLEVLADPMRFQAPRRIELGISASGFLSGGS